MSEKVLVSMLMFFGFLAVSGQTLSKGVLKEVNVAAADILVDKDYKNGRWDPLIEAVGEKKIVLLGEFNHGSREVFVTRNDLIRKLHSELGFDVILFESGIGEVAAVEFNKDKINGPFLTLGFFGAWRSLEFQELMEFAKEKNISVGGFDVQRTGRTFGKFLEDIAREMGVDPKEYLGLEDRFSEVARKLRDSKTVFEAVKQETLDLAADYERLEKLLARREPKGMDPELMLVRKTISNRVRYLEFRLEFLKDRDWSKRWEARDSEMASNVAWLIKNFFRDRKVVIIGHNFHIAKFNEKGEVMGEFLAREFGAEMFSLGVFAAKGSFLGNSGLLEEMSPPDGEFLDLKDVIRATGNKVSFVELSGDSGIFSREMIVGDTFIDLSGTKSITLSDHFDGLLLIDKVTPAEMIRWN